MELLPEGEKNNNEVTWIDQQKINEFSKLINRKDDLLADLKRQQQEKEYLDDLSMELELVDEDELINYKIGPTFLLIPQLKVLERIEKDGGELDVVVSGLSESIEEIEDRLEILKKDLYKKFGNAINLESILFIKRLYTSCRSKKT